MNPLGKAVLMFDMLIGRLEIFPFMALVYVGLASLLELAKSGKVRERLRRKENREAAKRKAGGKGKDSEEEEPLRDDDVMEIKG
jgi:hypothetical protein